MHNSTLRPHQLPAGSAHFRQSRVSAPLALHMARAKLRRPYPSYASLMAHIRALALGV